jgi:inosine-uridine nucleoside N-ribohydrolase
MSIIMHDLLAIGAWPDAIMLDRRLVYVKIDLNQLLTTSSSVCSTYFMLVSGYAV